MLTNLFFVSTYHFVFLLLSLGYLELIDHIRSTDLGPFKPSYLQVLQLCNLKTCEF